MTIRTESLAHHVVHDEASSSVALQCEGSGGDLISNEPSVHRNLSITKEEYYRKVAMLRKLVSRKNLTGGSGFVSCKQADDKDGKIDHYDVEFYTRKGASLTISLSKYQDKTYYFGTMGSPVKILTGQNLVEHAEEQKVSRLAGKLRCTLFEARSLYGFFMIRDCVKAEIGEDLFTTQEARDIRQRNISVFSVGFATYRNLGPRRDEMFHTMCVMAKHAIVSGGTETPLAYYLGSSVVGLPKDDGSENHQYTSLLIQKKIRNAIGLKQMIYLKDKEIEAKVAGSGAENHRVMTEELSTAQRREVDTTMLRIDNVFMRGYLRQWLGHLAKAEGRKVVDEEVDDNDNDKKNIMLSEIAHLFDNRNLVLDMSRLMTHELGVLPKLMGSPTLARIRFLAYSDNPKNPTSQEERELLKLWAKEFRCTIVGNNKRPQKPEVKSILGTDKTRRKVAQRILDEYRIDLTVPFDYYVYLDELRLRVFVPNEYALEYSHHATQGTFSDSYTGELTKEQIDAISREKGKEFIAYCKGYIPKVNTNKQALIEQHIFSQ
mgnify:FL=1